MNTNNIPQFTQADNAMANRLFMITWNSKFTLKIEEVDPENHVYLADTTIGGELWKRKYLPHLFNYLVKYHQKWLQNGEVIPEPEEMKTANEDILNFSDNFKTWLKTVAIPTGKVRDSISINNLAMNLIKSEYWINLPKHVKNMGAANFLKKELKDRESTRVWYRKQKTENKRHYYGGFLTGYLLLEKCNMNNDDTGVYLSDDEDKENINNSNRKTRKRLLSKSSDDLDIEPPNKKHKGDGSNH